MKYKCPVCHNNANVFYAIERVRYRTVFGYDDPQVSDGQNWKFVCSICNIDMEGKFTLIEIILNVSYHLALISISIVTIMLLIEYAMKAWCIILTAAFFIVVFNKIRNVYLDSIVKNNIPGLVK